MNKAHEDINWQDLPIRNTPLAARNLNKMDHSIDVIDDRVIALDGGKVGSVTVTNTLPTGDTIATITVDGTSTNIKSAQITVDNAISTTSTNPVQNKVIAEALREVMPEVTVEGNPISITDGSNIVPAKLAEVTFLPKQDLHGYDSPWVGGAGKNKLITTVSDIKSANTSGTWSGDTYTLNNVVFTILTDSDGNVIGINANGTASAQTNFNIFRNLSLNNVSYTLNGCPSGGGSSTYRQYVYYGETTAYDNGSGVEFTPNDTVLCSIRIISGYNAQNLKFYPMIRLSTVTDSTFAPYSNNCPISGRDSVEVVRTGKNRYPIQIGADTFANNVGGSHSNSDGTLIVNCSTSTSSGVYSSGNSELANRLISMTGNVSYSFDIRASVATSARIGYESAGSTYISVTTSWQRISITTTVPATKKLFVVYGSGTEVTFYIKDFQLEYGSTATPYEPYQGETYTENLGQTVYGGKVDFVSGECVIDRAVVDFGDYSWSRNTAGTYGYWWKSGFTGVDLTKDLIAEQYEGFKADLSVAQGNKIGVTVLSNNNLYVCTDDSENEPDGLLCYPLATPTELTLTPQEIELLKGTNVLWSDSNGNIKLVYSADIKAWVENQLSNS